MTDTAHAAKERIVDDAVRLVVHDLVVLEMRLWIEHGRGGDIAGGGYVLPVPDDVKKSIEWDDILPLYRERIADWGGTTYASHLVGRRNDSGWR